MYKRYKLPLVLGTTTNFTVIRNSTSVFSNYACGFQLQMAKIQVTEIYDEIQGSLS